MPPDDTALALATPGAGAVGWVGGGRRPSPPGGGSAPAIAGNDVEFARRRRSPPVAAGHRPRPGSVGPRSRADWPVTAASL